MTKKGNVVDTDIKSLQEEITHLRRENSELRDTIEGFHQTLRSVEQGAELRAFLSQDLFLEDASATFLEYVRRFLEFPVDMAVFVYSKESEKQAGEGFRCRGVVSHVLDELSLEFIAEEAHEKNVPHVSGVSEGVWFRSDAQIRDEIDLSDINVRLSQMLVVPCVIGGLHLATLVVFTSPGPKKSGDTGILHESEVSSIVSLATEFADRLKAIARHQDRFVASKKKRSSHGEDDGA